jgi:2'-5' RNA ligase
MAETLRNNSEAASRVRAFIACGLPPEVERFLQKIQSDLKTADWPVTWVRPGNIHLTLKFLGDVERSELEPIGEAMKEAAAGLQPFALYAMGLGAFPGIRRPRVLWCGIGGDLEPLQQLYGRLEKALSALGVKPEGRSFKGHLTLGRVKGRINPEELVDAAARYGRTASEKFVVDGFHLYQSRLTPEGPVYSKLCRAALG